MGVIEGKDIKDRTIESIKFKDIYTVNGDITQNNIDIELTELNIILTIEYITSSTARLGIRTISGTQNMSINRLTKYDSNSYEGVVNDSFTVTEDINYSIDNLIYTNSNDITRVEIANGNIWYLIKYFISNGGVNTRIRITKQ